MVRIAILGGSGHVGKTLAEVIGQDHRHSVIVLGRKVPDQRLPCVEYVQVDYTNVMSMTSLLEDRNVNTVVSCLMLTDDPIFDAEAAVVNAANASKCTHRFIASNWGPPTNEIYLKSAPWFPHQLAIRKRLRETSLEWTEIATGYFLDYWGMPHIKTNMSADMPALDIVNGVAGIPGTGNELISFTYTFDVAKVLCEIFLIPVWDTDVMFIVGDRLTWNKFVALAECARGMKFKVSYDPIDDLAKGNITELPNHRGIYHEFAKEDLRTMYSGIGLMMAKGIFDMDPAKSTHHHFAHITMTTISDMLRDVWKARRM